MRRTWIEITMQDKHTLLVARRPPCGGRGLKYYWVATQKHGRRRPPCGGRGLKCVNPESDYYKAVVVLHAEDVD